MLALLLAAAAAPAPAAVKPVCQGALPQRIDSRGAMRPRKLNEEPAAVPIYTVLHSENGCTRPVPVGSRR